MVLQITDVSVKYGKRTVLQGISHTFEPGWTHIIGPNGAGKSTLLKVLAGLCAPNSGSVTLDACHVQNMPMLARAQRIAYVPQRLESVPALTVVEFVAQGCFAWHKLEASDDDKMMTRAMKALQALGLESFASRRLDKLSGGEVQLCVLASAMAQNTDIILLDEPTTGLDIGHTTRFCHALDHLIQTGITVISTTHDLRLAVRYADAFVLLKDGVCHYAGKDKPETEVWAHVFDLLRDDAEICRWIQETRETKHISAHISKTDGEILPPKKKKLAHIYGICACVCLGLCCVGPFVGATSAWPWDGAVGWEIFWSLRVPRVIWGAVCGAVLAVCGAVMQSLFQNPLATPYTLGVASGASLGAMAAIQLGVSGILGVPLAACLGGLLSMFTVLGIAARYGLRQPIYCLMAGVAASMFCSAFGMVIQAFAEPLTAQQMMRWQLGGLEVVGYSEFLTLPVIILALGYLWNQSQSMNIISVDSELAASRGIAVEKTRAIALLSAGIMTSVIVSVCGPIGFVGLIIPNALRRFLGADLRCVLPLSAMIGASFVVFADMISRLLEPVAWLPVGVVTAMVGAPIFIAAILKKA